MIQVSPFLGRIPKVSDRLVPDAHSVIANQCDLESMSLRPARAGLDVAQVDFGSKSISRHPLGDWFASNLAGVKLVLSPLNDDIWSRVYFTGVNAPRMGTYQDFAGAGISFLLGVPEPTSNLAVTAPGGEPPEGGVEVDAVYTYTFVSAYGEEGPPAPPSLIATRYDSGAVTLSSISSPPTGSYNIASKRIYRSETGGVYLLVAEVPASTASYIDNKNTEDLGVAIPSLDWDMPDPRMQGLTNIGNGILAGYFENTLCFCEPYRPHAWPVGYQLGFESKIMGISPVSGGLVVATQQAPWLVGGVSPAAMSQTKLDVYFGSVSEASMADMGEYAIYASDEGLIAIGGQQSQLITQELMSRDQWQELNPSSIHGFRWRDRYIAFYKKTNGTKGVFLLHPEHGIVDFPSTFEAGFLDPTTGQLYVSDKSGKVVAWGQGEKQLYTWRSKEFTLPMRASMPVLKIDGMQSTTNPVRIKVWVNYELLIDESVTDTKMIRLPSGRYRNWQFELTGTAEVFSVQIAASPAFLL